MIKLILVRTFKDLGVGGSTPPLGILYLSSFLKKRIRNINIIISDYYFDGFDGLIKKLKDFNPDIIGFSTMSCEKDLLLELLKVKKFLKNESKVVVGGSYATFNYEEVVKITGIDYCVVGEGELVLTYLILSLLKKKNLNIPNLVTRYNVDNFKRDFDFYIKDLDSIPFPDWDLIDFAKYSNTDNWNGINRKKIYSPILTSRGCPYNCSFCHNVLGKRFRFRSVRNVIEEISYLYKNYKVEEFHIFDDVFNYNYERARDIFLEIKKIYGKSLSFSFPNGIRADIFDDKLASIMSSAGVYKIYFGVESAVDKIRNDLVKKNISLKDIDKAVNICIKNKIIPCGYFIYGLGEDDDEFEINLEYIKKSKFLIAHFFKYSNFSHSTSDFLFNYNIDKTSFRILKSYVEFYLNFRRLFLILLNYPFSFKTFKNIFVLLYRALLYKLIITFISASEKIK